MNLGRLAKEAAEQLATRKERVAELEADGIEKEVAEQLVIEETVELEQENVELMERSYSERES